MSAQPQRAFTTAFKESVVLRLQAGERLAAVADELASSASCFTNGAMLIADWGSPG